jgi:DNA adenine methylase
MTLPIVKWAGGKRKLAPLINEALGTGKGTYHEPFAGSLAVWLAATRYPAVLSDACTRLMHTYRIIRDQPQHVASALLALPTEPGWEEAYYLVRDYFNMRRASEAHPSDYAARFIWLNHACFNGLYRENRQGAFNVPVGRYKRLSMPSPMAIRAVAKHFCYGSSDRYSRGPVELHARDWRVSLADVAPGDLVYLDPPYWPRSKAGFVGYSLPWDAAEHAALAAAALKCAQRGARVVASNHDLPEVRALYPEKAGWTYRTVEVQRSISCGKREKVAELIISGGPT